MAVIISWYKGHFPMSVSPVQPLRKINDTFRASPPHLQQEFYQRKELQNIANALRKKSFEQSYLICAKLA